jgi:hypothetical protein
MRTILLLLFLALSGSSLAAAGIPEDEMKATYLYNFAAFTDWREPVGGSFNLCVLGDGGVGSAVGRLEGKRLNGIPVKVARLAGLSAIRGCQLLFVPAESGWEMSQVMKELGNRPVLTVSDSDADAAGAVISLSLEGNRLVFDVNEGAAKSVRLTISSKLLSLARRVR